MSLKRKRESDCTPERQIMALPGTLERWYKSVRLGIYRKRRHNIRYNFHPNGLCVLSFDRLHPLQDLQLRKDLEGLQVGFPWLGSDDKVVSVGKSKKGTRNVRASDWMLRIDFASREDVEAMEELWEEYLPSRTKNCKGEASSSESPGTLEGQDDRTAEGVNMARTFVMQRAALGGTLLEVNEKLREDADLDAALGESIEHCFIAILEPNAQQTRSFLTMAERPENGVSSVSVSVGRRDAEARDSEGGAENS